MKSNFINIYFSNFLLKWLGLTLWITEPIKLISRKYFISPLGDYEFHLENICSINTKCGCPTYWGFDRNFRSHSWYIKATYTLWSGPLFFQDKEFMQIEVVRFIIHLTVVRRIINLIAVQFNIPTRSLYFHDQDKSS